MAVRKKKKARKKNGFRLRVNPGILKGLKLIIVLIFLFTYTRTVIRQETNIQRAKDNIAKQVLLNEEMAVKNDALKNKADGIGSESYIMANARTRLGMAMPGEIIIEQGTPPSVGAASSENSDETEESDETQNP